MSDKSTFYSPYGDAFWDQQDVGVKNAMADIVDKDCKKGIASGIVICCFLLLAFGWGLTAAIKGEIMEDLRLLLFLIFAPVCMPAFVSAIVRSRRYQIKSRQGRIRVAHVRITNREMVRGTIKNKFVVEVESTTSSAPANIEVEKNFYDKAGIGICGWFSMVEDEGIGLLASPYWFIADTDPKAFQLPAPAVSASPVAAPATVYTEARVSNARPEDLASAYFHAHMLDVILSAISAVLFFLGGLWLALGSSINLDNSTYAGVFLLPYALLLMVCLAVQTPVHMHESNDGRKVSILYLALQFFPSIFLMVLLLQGSSVVRLLVSLFLLVFNLLMVFLLNKGLIDTYGEIKKGRYNAVSGVLISRNQTSRYIYPIFLIKICTCVVEAGSNTYEVKITPSQYKDYFDGMTGTLMILDKGGRNIFVRC